MTAKKTRPKEPRPSSIDLSHSSIKRSSPKAADYDWGYSIVVGLHVPRKGRAGRPHVPKKTKKSGGGRGVPNKRQTSPSVASKAGKQLASKSETKAEKSVAASALAQTKSKAGRKK